MQINRSRCISWGVFLLFCFQQNIGQAADFSQHTETFQIDYSGYLSLRSLQNESDDESNTNYLTATALFKSQVKFDHDLLAIQLRPLLTHTTNPDISETSGYVDELYWEHRFSASTFTFLGRQKIVNGVAIGRNPSDFFNQGKTKDRTLNDEDRRAETEGDDILGWSYFGQSYSIQSLLATPTGDSKHVRAMLQENNNLSSLSTDVSFTLYYADNPSLGINLATVFGENTTGYAEFSLRYGRDRQCPVLSINDVVIGTEDDAKRWFDDVVIGSQYTTGIGTTITIEYWRNNHGFSDEEYTKIENSLVSGQGNPGIAKSLLTTSNQLRKNYLFVKVGDIPLLDTLKGEITWIGNLDDSSNFLRCALNWDIGKADSLRIGFDEFWGSQLSEYGSKNITSRFFLIYKKYF